MRFWHGVDEPPPKEDRALCLIRLNGKVHPEVCTWFEKHKAFSLPCLFPEKMNGADWVRYTEIEAWAALADLPPWFG